MLEAPITVSQPLATLYDSVGIQMDKLAGILPSLDLDATDLSDTHIHLAHRAPYSLSDRRPTIGQCVKVLHDPTDKEQEQRAAYIDYLVPGIPREKIDDTTFVAVDLPGITIENFIRINGLRKGDVRPAQEPRMIDLESAICRQASKVLMHELLHVPRSMPVDASEEEHSQHRDAEESFVDERLAELGERGIPSRLINIRLPQRFNMGDMANILQTIQNHRRS